MYFNTPEPPSYPTINYLSALAEQIEIQREVVDSHLIQPAKWRGRMRREVHGYCQPGEDLRYIEAYNFLVAEVTEAASTKFDISYLQKIHHLAVGGSDFRTSGLRVGNHHDFPPASKLDSLVQDILSRATLSEEAAVITAARIHIQLLAVHPFSDGNGRTSRLMATLWLARAGFKSGLFLAVEQYFSRDPRYYIELLDKFQYGLIDEDECVILLLQVMMGHSIYAAWFRAREKRLRSLCAHLHIPILLHNQVLIDFDITDISTPGDFVRKIAANTKEIPFRLCAHRMSSPEKNELIYQVNRLLDEEALSASQ